MPKARWLLLAGSALFFLVGAFGSKYDPIARDKIDGFFIKEWAFSAAIFFAFCMTFLRER